MIIKKLGHCCLLIKTETTTILTDPGAYSTSQNEAVGVDIVLITHEHADHLHTESLVTVLKNNPNAKVVSNTSVAKILEKEQIPVQIIEDGQEAMVCDCHLAGHGTEHADIFDTVTPAQNTGYFIDSKLFYPGDALTNPNKQVDILALPVAGPWLTIRNAIEYAIALKPRVAFPVHDGMLTSGREGPVHVLPRKVLLEHGIEFVVMKEGDEREF